MEWTEDDIQKVYGMMQEGMTATHAAKFVDMSSASLIAKMAREFGGWGPQFKDRRVKLPKNGSMDIEDNIIREMYPDPKFTIREIAKRLGRGEKTVQLRARRMGLKRPRKATGGFYGTVKIGPFSAEEDATLTEMWYKESNSILDIKITLNRSQTAVYRRAKELALPPSAAQERSRAVKRGELEPWPAGMFFEDHKDTTTSRTGARFVRGEI
tara:strand:+ start:177 stop:812 length:636 start_codon:yes stop_codon:yes gene_type:complete